MASPLPLFPTAYLPSVSYMACLAQYPAICIERHETFPKQTFRNRTRIATAGGEYTLTVPVIRPDGNHTTTGNILVSYHEPWPIRHWRTLVAAYNASPYFQYYADDLQQLLMQPYLRLLELNRAILEYLLCSMKIDCSITYSEEYLPAPHATHDYRHILADKHCQSPYPIIPYYQVFADRHGFLHNLSAIDLLFNLGPESKDYLMQLPVSTS